MAEKNANSWRGRYNWNRANCSAVSTASDPAIPYLFRSGLWRWVSLWSCQTVVRLRRWLHARLQQGLASSGHLDLGQPRQPGTCDTHPNTARSCSLKVARKVHSTLCTAKCTLGQSCETPAVHKTQNTVHFSPNTPSSIPCML